MKQSKKQNQSKSLLFPALLLILFFIVLVTLILKNIPGEENNLTGAAISAQGGNITYVNVTKDNANYWQGYFGEITVDASASTPSATARGGNVTELNLLLPCLGDEIYATTQNTITFEDLSAGTKEAVNAFLGLSSSHFESGSNVFTDARNFTVKETVIPTVPATFMKVSGSSNNPFALGVLNQSNVLILASNVSLNTIGFDGNTHDYQMMVPVNQSELTYFFFSDCEVVPAAPVPVVELAPVRPKKGGAGLPPVEEEVKPLVIEVILKEGKLLAPGYPIAIVVTKGEKTTQRLQIKNIGEGDLTNVYMSLSGLPLDLFTLSPQKYERVLPGEALDFLLEIKGDIEAGTYNIELFIFSDQGTTKISGVLIVKKAKLKAEKLPIVGAAVGFAAKYGRTIIYLLASLALLFASYGIYVIYVKTLQIRKLLSKRMKGKRR